MNRYTRAVAGIAAVLLLVGVVLALGSGSAAANRICRSTWHGYHALVEIPDNATCTGRDDWGVVLAVSDIPADQAKPAVLGPNSNRPGYLFFYEEDNLPNVIPTTARRSPLSPLNQNEDLQSQDDSFSVRRFVEVERRLDAQGRVKSTTRRLQDITIAVEYVTPDGDHRAVSEGDDCYREWRDENGDWRRSGSYGSDADACRQASWNAYQRWQGRVLYDPASPSRFPDGEAPGTLAKLVGNTGRTANANAQFGQRDQAQAFRTGSRTSGYTVTSVKFRLVQGTGDDPTFSVSIYSSGGNGLPSASLAMLAQPESLGAEGLYTFTAPEGGISLDPDRVYWIVIDTTVPGATNRIAVRATASNAEDSDRAAGWNIANDRYHRDWDAAQWTFDHRSLLIEIDGYAKP